MATTNKRADHRTGRQATRSEQRRAALAAQAAQAKRDERRRRLRNAGVGVAVVAVLAVVTTFLVRAANDEGAAAGDDPAASGDAPVVGGDLHTVFAMDDALYVGGHAAAAVSGDDGRTWRAVGALEGADAMGWAVSNDAILVGGHPGLYRSTDGGSSFEQLTGPSAVPDVHALGGAGEVAYLASPQAGVLASADGGATWKVRNADAGRSFMGTILVDPEDTDRLVAPDMSGALATSSDGGRTWSSLGGPMGAMAAAWNPQNTDDLIAAGMQGAERSTDGGTTWTPVSLPSGATAVTYAPDGKTVYAGVLSGERAVVYRSGDDGQTWSPTA